MFARSFLGSIVALLCLLSLSTASSPPRGIDNALLGPLSASGRWIVDGNGARVKMRCANWGGHLEVNIPEGLQAKSVSYIASWLARNGFNCVRLTYSIDMALNPNQTVADSFAAAAATTGARPSDMQALYDSAVAANPFLASATVLGAFSAVVDGLDEKGIRVVLDNHVSKASWCCNYTDGNGWWASAYGYSDINSRYFDTARWLAGLSAMATFASRHGNVVGMSLRNELRPLFPQDVNGYHDDWYGLVAQGARAVHAADADLLVVIGGTMSATEARFLHDRALDTGAWGRDKTVWEFHVYPWSYPLTSQCQVFGAQLGFHVGFLLVQGQAYTGPLWLSEFGVGMTGGPNKGLSDADHGYLACLVQYMEGNDADWAVWALQGSYYVRDGSVNYDEGYGLLDKSWSDWRNPDFRAMLGNMWNMTQTP